MSILTIIVTGGHLFFIDCGQPEIGHTLIAFVVFASILIDVSFIIVSNLILKLHNLANYQGAFNVYPKRSLISDMNIN